MRRERETAASSPRVRARAFSPRRRAPEFAVLTGLLILVSGAVAPPTAIAGTATRTAVELSLLAGYSDNDGWVETLPGSQRSAIGFEHFARLSGERGDYLTTDLQVRMSYDSEAPKDDAWALELHNAWIEHRLGLGRKVRIGHFSPAHGLEPVRDTHGTLVQTLAMMDIGFKKDWGVGYSGIAGPFDLEVALQTGSGMALAPADGSYLASAQVWTPPGPGARYGLSLVHGAVRTGGQPRTFPLPDYADGTVTKSRVGVAGEWTAGAFTVLAELSAGADDAGARGAHAVGGALLETDYSPPSNQRLSFQLQFRARDNDLEHCGVSTVTGLSGMTYLLTDTVTVRAALATVARDGELEDVRSVLQLYYYGG
jgi:hypothetical protein